MNTIKLKKIIDRTGADMNAIAQELFPGNKHPRLALARVINGEAFLDSQQISKLAFLLNVEISELFDVSRWKLRSEKGQITLSWDKYIVKIDTNNRIARIHCEENMIHEIVLYSETVTLSELVKNLNSIIDKFEQNGTN